MLYHLATFQLPISPSMDNFILWSWQSWLLYFENVRTTLKNWWLDEEMDISCQHWTLVSISTLYCNSKVKLVFNDLKIFPLETLKDIYQLNYEVFLPYPLKLFGRLLVMLNYYTIFNVEVIGLGMHIYIYIYILGPWPNPRTLSSPRMGKHLLKNPCW